MKKILFLILPIFSCLSCEAIFIDDISDEEMTINAPADRSEMPEGTIVFKWDAIENAEEYHVQVVTPSFFNAPQIVLDTLLPTTTLKEEFTKGSYQWQINARNSEYETISTTLSFKVN